MFLVRGPTSGCVGTAPRRIRRSGRSVQQLDAPAAGEAVGSAAQDLLAGNVHVGRPVGVSNPILQPTPFRGGQLTQRSE